MGCEAKDFTIYNASEGVARMMGGRREDEVCVRVLGEEGEVELASCESNVKVQEVDLATVVQREADVGMLSVEVSVEVDQGREAVWPNAEDVVLVPLPKLGSQRKRVHGFGFPGCHEEVRKGPTEGVAHGDAAGLEPQSLLESERVGGENSVKQRKECEVRSGARRVAAEHLSHGFDPLFDGDVCVEALHVHRKEDVCLFGLKGAQDGDEVARVSQVAGLEGAEGEEEEVQEITAFPRGRPNV